MKNPNSIKLIIVGCILAGLNVGCNQKAEMNQTVDLREKSEYASTAEKGSVEHVEQKVDAIGKNKTELNKYAHWKYDETMHRLTISGKGATHDDAYAKDGQGEFFFNDENKSDIPNFDEKWEEVKEVIIEQGITKISAGAFYRYTNLEKVTIPDSVNELSDYVFYGCSSLKEIIIPDKVALIGEKCFFGCKSLNKLTLGKCIKNIGEGSFCGCQSLRKISISRQNKHFVTKKGILYDKKRKILCFAYANASNVTIPKGIKKIGEFAFYRNPYIQKIKISASVKTIEGGAFSQCKKLKKVTFAKQSKCKTIQTFFWQWGNGCGGGSFENCNRLKEMIFPESLRYIEDGTLYGCSSLEKIYFGKAFEGLNDDVYTFYDLIGETSSLKKFVVSENNPYFCSEDGVLFDKRKQILYSYPHGKTDSQYRIPKSTKKIYSRAFSCVKGLKALVVSRNNIKIGSKAFWKSKHITIYGTKKSTIQKYANKHNINFTCI